MITFAETKLAPPTIEKIRIKADGREVDGASSETKLAASPQH
jgi:hypothetical protein